MCNHGNDVTVPLPEHLRPYRNNKVDVSIDSCIVPHMEALWAEKIHTLGCCCGHGNIPPSIVITEGYNAEEVAKIRRILATVDDQEWEVFQWALTKITKEGTKVLCLQN